MSMSTPLSPHDVDDADGTQSETFIAQNQDVELVHVHVNERGAATTADDHTTSTPLSPSIATNAPSSASSSQILLASALADLHAARLEIKSLSNRLAHAEQAAASTHHTTENAFNSRGAVHVNDSAIDDPASHRTYCYGCLSFAPGHHHPTMTVDEYFVTSTFRLLMRRLPWLIGLLLLQSFSASILANYSGFLADHAIFAYFVPMVVGTGGNAGNQCSVMVTRALALGMGDAEVIKVVKKEAPIAVITSLVLAFFAFLRVIAEYPNQATSSLAIAFTLLVSILISIAMGIFFSYGIEKLKKCDPADGAAPLLTTISDLIGISLLCGIAVSMVG